MATRDQECGYCGTDHDSDEPCPELDGEVVDCVVACGYAGNGPGFFPVRVRCTTAQYENGDHYEKAEEVASEQPQYDGPFVVYDENDGPEWLFKQFDWAAVATVHDIVGAAGDDE